MSSFIVFNINVIADTVFVVVVVVEYLIPMATHINSYMDFFTSTSHDDMKTTLQLGSVIDCDCSPLYFLLRSYKDSYRSLLVVVVVVYSKSSHGIKCRFCIFYSIRPLCFDTFCDHTYLVG